MITNQKNVKLRSFISEGGVRATFSNDLTFTLKVEAGEIRAERLKSSLCSKVQNIFSF